LRQPSSDPIPTGFKDLGEGGIIDLIRPQGVRDASLVLYRNASTRIGDRIEYGDQIYVVPPDPILERIHLSRRIAINAPCPSFDEVFASVLSFLERFIDFSSSSDAFGASLFSLADWFSHRTSVAPYLSIVGPPGSGKTRLAQCLRLICRRALLFSDITAASLRSIPMWLRPTLIMDEVEITDDLVRLLRTGTARGACAYYRGKAIDLFCPKIIVTHSPLLDAALAHRVIQIQMAPTSRSMPQLTPNDVEAFETLLVPKIHRYFLENYHKGVPPQLDLSCLSPHQRDVARVLATPFDTPFGQQSVVTFLKLQDESTHFERSYTREAAVVAALLALCGNSGQDFALMGAIAAGANQQMIWRGERVRFTPKAVGGIVHRLGFKTERIGSIGRGIWMNQGVIKTTYNLARYHGVLQVESAGAGVGGTHNVNVGDSKTNDQDRDAGVRKHRKRKSRNKRRKCD
jgi:hypothetical protein